MDRIDLADAHAALEEAEEKGTISLWDLMTANVSSGCSPGAKPTFDDPLDTLSATALSDLRFADLDSFREFRI